MENVGKELVLIVRQEQKNDRFGHACASAHHRSAKLKIQHYFRVGNFAVGAKITCRNVNASKQQEILSRTVPNWDSKKKPRLPRSTQALLAAAVRYVTRGCYGCSELERSTVTVIQIVQTGRHHRAKRDDYVINRGTWNVGRFLGC